MADLFKIVAFNKAVVLDMQLFLKFMLAKRHWRLDGRTDALATGRSLVYGY